MSAILDILPAIAYHVRHGKAPPPRRVTLRVARAELRLSQGELADAGVTRQTIGSIENEQYVPSAYLAFVLARALGKPVDQLFYLEGDRP
jgi:putative transcriptional regulator